LKDYAASKDKEYEAVRGQITDQEKALAEKQKEIDGIKKELITQQDTLSEGDKTAKAAELKAKETEASTIKNNLGDNKAKEALTLKNIKATDYKNSDEFKKSLNEARVAQEKADQEKYGDIKKTKDFTAAMKLDYVDDLRNNTMWMKDGKQREGLWDIGGGAGGLGATGFFATKLGGFLSSTLGTMLGVGTLTATAGGVGLAGAIFAERMKFEQEALDAATSAYISDYKKGRVKETKVSQLNKKIKDLDKTVDDTVKDALRNAKRSESELDTMTMEMKKEEIKNHLANMEDELEEKKVAFDKVRDAYKKNKNPSKDDEEAFRKAARAQREASDHLNKAKNVWENREKAQDELDKETEKAKAAADKK